PVQILSDVLRASSAVRGGPARRGAQRGDQEQSLPSAATTMRPATAMGDVHLRTEPQLAAASLNTVAPVEPSSATSGLPPSMYQTRASDAPSVVVEMSPGAAGAPHRIPSSLPLGTRLKVAHQATDGFRGRLGASAKPITTAPFAV